VGRDVARHQPRRFLAHVALIDEIIGLLARAAMTAFRTI